MRSFDPALHALTAALQERDAYTREHSDRVVILCAELGEACGMSADALAPLHIAAQFHDIGKIGVPDNVLLKPGSLNQDEWALMKAHSIQGDRIFRAIKHPVCELVAPIILHHHEAFDGHGYPAGLKAKDIPLSARLLTIADAYDAMSTVRPYREAMPHEKIMEIIDYESERKFDPDLVRIFEKIIERHSNLQSSALLDNNSH